MLTNSRFPVYLAWLVAIVAMLGSLYFSEVLHLVPCVLCWYQRILLYPLVLIIGIGLLRKDPHMPYYVLPMSILGLGIALFHYLLQMGVLPDALAPCSQGVSCTTRFIILFDFVTIPFLSFVAFVMITVCMLLFVKKGVRYE